MKNMKKLNQKIQRKRNKRKNRQIKTPFGIQYHGIDYEGTRTIKLEDIPQINPYQNRSIEDHKEDKTTSITSSRYHDYLEKFDPKTKKYPKPEQGKNECGFPWVDLGGIPVVLIEHLESPTNQKMKLRDVKLINDQRMFSPNGNKVPWSGWTIKDSFFAGRDLDQEVGVYLRTLKNSTYFRLYERDGFTEEILNDPEEMKEYMCWVVRMFFDDELSDRFVKVNKLDSLDDLTNIGEVIKGQKYQGLFVDCPVDLYMEMFLKNHIPLKKVS